MYVAQQYPIDIKIDSVFCTNLSYIIGEWSFSISIRISQKHSNETAIKWRCAVHWWKRKHCDGTNKIGLFVESIWDALNEPAIERKLYNGEKMLSYKSYGVLWLLDNCALAIELLLMFKEFHGRWMRTSVCDWALIMFRRFSFLLLCISSRSRGENNATVFIWLRYKMSRARWDRRDNARGYCQLPCHFS